MLTSCWEIMILLDLLVGIGLREASDVDMEDIRETVVNDNKMISSLSCQDSYLC